MTTTTTDTVTYMTPKCIHCGEQSIVEIDRASHALWNAGAYVQVAFPHMSADEREMLMTGTHPECWAAIFGEGEDDAS